MTVMVQIYYEHTWSDQELHERAKVFALQVKPEVPGLIWKMFATKEQPRATSGVYLFDTMASAQAYVNGERVATMKTLPQHSDITIRVFEVLEEESILAGAPL